jgi:hypothetical protein
LHGALEALFAPALIAAPFLLGFGPATGAASLALGAVLIGHALSIQGERRAVPLSTHAAFDYVIASITILAGIVLGLVNGEPQATAFMAGFGAAHMALTASTRFSVRGA